MLLDGIYVLLKGKYIGPEKPWPWPHCFTSLTLMYLSSDFFYYIGTTMAHLVNYSLGKSAMGLPVRADYINNDALVSTRGYNILFGYYPDTIDCKRENGTLKNIMMYV
jgi:hypothetical protein